jgi:hypothetical protein
MAAKKKRGSTTRAKPKAKPRRKRATPKKKTGGLFGDLGLEDSIVETPARNPRHFSPETTQPISDEDIVSEHPVDEDS